MCKDCQHLSKEELLRAKNLRTVFGILNQSNISSRNIDQLRELSVETDSEVVTIAELVLRVASVHPRRRRRLGYLRREHPRLLQQLIDTSLVVDDEAPAEFENA